MMKNIILVSFVLLSSCVLLDAIYVSQWRPKNWTDLEIENGYKLVGDMAFSFPTQKEELARAWGTSNKWAGGRVPYVISSSISAANQAIIRSTMSLLSSKVNNCVRFVQRTSSDPNYVNIIPNGSGCYSYLGNIRRGAQALALDSRCQRDRGTIAHELMHALGFHHEQNRSDRDKYVFLDFNQLPGQQDQYLKEESGNAYSTSYDYQSLMHYPRSNGMYAINPRGASIPGSWYRQDADIPSVIDIQGIKNMYC